MQKSLQRKLEWYGISTTGLLLLSSQANAQIVYTDIDPDITCDEFSLPYYLNVDGPGTPIDFVFGVNYAYYYLFASNAILAAPWFFEAENGIAGSPYMSGGFFNKGLADQLDEGAYIGYGVPFVDNNFLETSSYIPQAFLAVHPEFAGLPNNWEDDGNPHYLGIKFIMDGALHYGWVRLSIDPGFNSIHIYDYAYNLTPNASIIAGDAGGCSAPEPIGSGSYTTTSAKVKWAPIADAAQYEVNFRALGAATWMVAPVDAPKTFRKLSGLDCNTIYEWKVRSLCTDGTTSLFSDTNTFTTAVCREANEPDNDVEVYANGKTIYLTNTFSTEASVQIFDLQGNLVLQKMQIDENAVIQTDLPSGLYIVSLNIAAQKYNYKVVLTD